MVHSLTGVVATFGRNRLDELLPFRDFGKR